jgi:hypothetical protein
MKENWSPGWLIRVTTPGLAGTKLVERDFWVGEPDKQAAVARVRDRSHPAERIFAVKPLFQSELTNVGVKYQQVKGAP